MAWTTDYLRKLVNQLDASSAQRRGARVTPEAVDLILAALRVYRGALVARPSDKALHGFQVEAVDELNLPLEVLAATPDENIAHAILAAAKERFPAWSIVVRGATISSQIKAAVVKRGPYKVQGGSGRGTHAWLAPVVRRRRRGVLDHALGV